MVMLGLVKEVSGRLKNVGTHMFENKIRKAVLKKATQGHHRERMSLFVSTKHALSHHASVSLRKLCSGIVYILAHGWTLTLSRINMENDVIICATQCW